MVLMKHSNTQTLKHSNTQILKYSNTMDLGLKGKNAIVTGAAGGVGKAIALALSAEGANVAIGDIRDKEAEAVE